MSYLNNKMAPTGASVKQRNIVQEPFNFDLFESILTAENIRRAWKQVKANKGSAGIDGMTIEEFPEWAKSHWQQCKTQMFEGNYRPMPVKRVEVGKPDGGKRPLGIPTILDRVIQQAITQILSPLVDKTFSDNSFGFRPKRSAHHAVIQVLQIIKQKRRIAVDVDLSRFFDRVDHDLLMRNLSRHCKDKRLLKLIGHYLRAGIMENGVLLKSIQGVPQGGPLSPLLSNIMLDDLDKELESRGHQFARYADDFIILVRAKRAGERVLESITCFLQTRLKLNVNTDKSQVVKSSQSKFLGFT